MNTSGDVSDSSNTSRPRMNQAVQMQRIRSKLKNKDRNKDHTASEIDVTQQSVNVLLNVNSPHATSHQSKEDEN